MKNFLPIVLSVLLSGNLFGQIVVSDFAANNDGWTCTDQDGVVTYNTGGYITGNDYNIVLSASLIPIYWTFLAPAKFTGNKSAYYNGTLSFDLQQTTTRPWVQQADIAISAGTTAIYYFNITPNYPATAPGWTSYSIPINELSGNWKTSNSSTGVAATASDIQFALANSINLVIRGRYGAATSTGSLDNVKLTPFVVTTQPAPNTAACPGTNVNLTAGGTGVSPIQFQWQMFIAGVGFVNLTNTAPYSNVTTATLTIATTPTAGAGTYRCLLSSPGYTGVPTNNAVVTVYPLPATPGATGNNGCVGNTQILTATGATAGQYRWYTVATGGTAIVGATNATYTTPALSTTTSYYVAINNGTCEGLRNTATATVTPTPGAPGATGAQACNPASLNLNATGAAAGQYRWYTVATGGTPISGAVNSSYTTATQSVTQTYYVAINISGCEGPRTAVLAQILTPPAAPTAGGGSNCGPGPVTITASGGSAGQYRWYTLATGGTAIVGETNPSYTTPSLTGNTTYYVSINNGSCEGARSADVATINSLPATPVAGGGSNCGPGAVTITATGGTAGQYRWYTVAAGGTAIAGATNPSYTTGALSASTTYYVALNNGTCEGARAADIATINPLPAAPVSGGGSNCGPGAVTITATGGTAGQYRWYTVATGGTAIAGQTNGSYTTGALSASTTYYVSINNGTCEGPRTADIATINPIPGAPVSGGGSNCGSGAVTITASGGTAGQYRWYTVATGGTAIAGQTAASYTTPVLTASTTYYVSLNNGTCEGARTADVATINLLPAAPGVTPGSGCVGTTVTLGASGGTAGQYRWYTVATGGTAIGGQTAATYTTPILLLTTTFYVSINNGTCEGSRTSVTATVGLVPSAPGVVGASSCASPASLTLTATGGTAGQYRWYTVATGGTAIAGQTNDTYTTPGLNSSTNYYVSLVSGICESARSTVTAQINSVLPPPTVTGAAACGPSSVTLTAAGGAPSQYRWYTVATGGSTIAGETSPTYTTPTLNASTTFYVAINNISCESSRTAVTATINDIPSAPGVINGSSCLPGSVLLTASGASNGSYLWYTDASGGTAITGETNSTYNTPSIAVTTTYYVSIDNGNCESLRSPVTATIAPCDKPPVIATSSSETQIDGTITISLAGLLSDPDDNIDTTTLKIIIPPASGATATINSVYDLVLDYRSRGFSGTDSLEIEVCDLAGLCAQQWVYIEVIGDVQVYNGISPNGDSKNDNLIIKNIEALEDTRKNHVSIYDRWGDVVFEIDNYDNASNIFKGVGKSGSDLPIGTYFYKIEFASGKKTLTGYLSLRR